MKHARCFAYGSNMDRNLTAYRYLTAKAVCTAKREGCE